MGDYCGIKQTRFPNHTERKAGGMGDNIPGGIVAAASKFSSHTCWKFQGSFCNELLNP